MGVPGTLVVAVVPGTQYLSPFAFVASRRTGLASVEGAAKAFLQARHEPVIAQRTPRPKVTPKRRHRLLVLLLREPPPVPHLGRQRPPCRDHPLAAVPAFAAAREHRWLVTGTPCRSSLARSRGIGSGGG